MWLSIGVGHELGHQVQGVVAMDERQVVRIERAGSETLDVVGGGPERKIGSEEDLLGPDEIGQRQHGHGMRRLCGIVIESLQRLQNTFRRLCLVPGPGPSEDVVV